MRQVLYQTSGRDNDYSEIDIKDELSFFNPKAGLTWMPSETLQGFVSAAVAHREPARSDYLDSPQDTPLRPERLFDVEAGDQKARRALGRGCHVVQHAVHRPTCGHWAAQRRRQRGSGERGGQLPSRCGIGSGAAVDVILRFDANATLAENKIAQFEETVYDYDSNFDYENTIVHENTDIALSPNAVAMGMLTFEAPKDGAFAGLSVSLIGKHVGQQFLDNTSNEGRAWRRTRRWTRWFARSAPCPPGRP